MKNEPQRLLNLGRYEFITFVDVHKPLPHDGVKLTRIYFLVKPPHRNSLRLMVYRNFAWPIDEENDELERYDEDIKIFTGQIDI